MTKNLNKISRNQRSKRNQKIPSKDLKSIFKSLPNITHSQLLRIRFSAPKKTYKKLKNLCSFIDKSTINDLQKATNSLMQIATTLSSDAAFSNLVEESK
ncbi:hypothetical protein [Helicobacter macacae]|uniref:Uncharacterized protein n=1 Tax=Helicobacter macacae MIT 99-5501 TaxID=1357400 RepID=V8CCQ0_9HELI|nr:hypothetical protein [Helicobacter macacae]ETD25129.1 hypothetical protein HMPREF2086_00464 [Helicobacter macacae MIT 99-5501]